METRGTLVVVPAWNEEQSLPAVLTELRAHLPDVDVLIVDDGSTDQTADIAGRNGVAEVAKLPFNLGVGAAVRTGFLHARRHGYTTVVQVDADGQHDPRDIPRLLAGIRDGADVVIGARFAGVGDYQVHGPRWAAMRLLARALSWKLGTELTDVTSGFRASGPRAISLFADEYPPEYLGDTVESLVLASRAGLSVRQVPVAMRPRLAGQASQGALRASIYLARALLVLLLSLMHRGPGRSRS